MERCRFITFGFSRLRRSHWEEKVVSGISQLEGRPRTYDKSDWVAVSSRPSRLLLIVLVVHESKLLPHWIDHLLQLSILSNPLNFGGMSQTWPWCVYEAPS
jgi:hypothetical protein